ncbi:MAG: carboxylesterase family protein [Planctomycetota bacterium]|jgi:predicted esterase
MERFRRFLVSLVAGAFLMPALASPRALAEASREAPAIRILHGDAPDAEAVERLKALEITPRALARVLRRWRPAGPAPFHGRKKFALRGADGRKTDLWAYVPQAYQGKKAWPCIVALHGRGGNGRQMITMARFVADRWGWILLAPSAKKFDGMPPIHPHWWKYTQEGFPLAALRWGKSRLFIDDDRVLLLGYSMGGFGTWNIGLRHPDPFFALAPFAGGISQAEYLGQKDERRRALLVNAALGRLFFAHGEADRVVPARFDRESHTELEKAGIPHVYREVKGGRHILEEIVAAGRGDFEKGHLMVELFDGLRGKKRASPTGPFSFTAIETPARVRFLSIEKAESFPCRVDVRTEGNAIHVDSEGVMRLSLFLDDAHFDLDRPVEVRIRGVVVHREKPAASLETLVRQWRMWRDRKRLFSVRIGIDVPEPEDEGF